MRESRRKRGKVFYLFHTKQNKMRRERDEERKVEREGEREKWTRHKEPMEKKVREGAKAEHPS